MKLPTGAVGKETITAIATALEGSGRKIWQR